MDNTMNNEKRGKFLKNLRKSKKLTQAQLGELINYSDKNISKWENGISFPTDPETLTKLSSIFNVSFEELLYGDFKNEDNTEKITESTLEVYIDNYKSKIKFKKLMCLSLATLLIFSIIFLLSTYFIFIRGKINSYKITGSTKNGESISGSLFISNDISILNFNKIKNVEDVEKIYLYIDNENKEKIVLKGDNDNYYVEEKNGSKEYNLKEIPKTNLYIKISYNDDTSEIINLNIEKKYTNNTVFPKKVDEIASDDNNDDNQDVSTSDFKEKLLNLGFKYNEGLYKKEINKNVIMYINDYNKDIKVDIEKADLLERISLYNYSNTFLYEKLKNGNLIDHKEIELSEKLDCSIKKCNTVNDYIKYMNFIKEYLQ